ncbi:MAG TPA: hypothetical protein VGH99_24210 [Pseudonocardia sp.]|jgi:hypothetical protein
MTEPAEQAARRRWRAAEDRLYPTLIADPTNYQRALTQIRAVVTELGRRGDDMGALLAAEAEGDGLLASAGVLGAGVPTELLVGVACGVRDREIGAERDRRRIERAVAQARAAGRQWVTLSGAESPGELVDGRSVALHLESGTTLVASIDVWSGGPPFAVEVIPEGLPEVSWSFDDRAAWLAQYERQRAAVETGRAQRP